MEIAYIQKTTLIDYPGEIASTVFIRGCNYNCSFCYNKALISKKRQLGDISIDECVDILLARKDKIDHVVITGGEPTYSSGIIDFLNKLKINGFKIKLDTNGSHPHILNMILYENLVDYVAMDIKADQKRYQDVVNSAGEDRRVLLSMKLLKEFCKDYEFRTTIYKELFTFEHFEEIFKFISSYVNKYFLQNFFNTPESPNFTPFKKSEIADIVNLAARYGINIRLRGDWQ